MSMSRLHKQYTPNSQAMSSIGRTAMEFIGVAWKMEPTAGMETSGFASDDGKVYCEVPVPNT